MLKIKGVLTSCIKTLRKVEIYFSKGERGQSLLQKESKKTREGFQVQR